MALWPDLTGKREGMMPPMRWRRGLVIGKFLPPHLGHSHLITTARRQVDELIVAVCDRAGDPYPAALRATWLDEMHPDCAVMVVDDIGHDDDSAVWAAYTRHFLGGAPDVVFTSEDYGATWADHLGCAHVSVDRARSTVPVSGTLVRTAPARYWGYLHPVVRAALVRRVAVVGAESTGTTTLARALARSFATEWVPEYAREICEEAFAAGRALEWSSADFVAIAAEQLAREDDAARLSGPLLFCDTDALATSIWHERYLGGRSPEVDAIAGGRRYAAYVLTACDIPFVQDGVRDGEHVREWMTARFAAELERRPEPWVLAEGPLERRVETVASFLTTTLGGRWTER
jgi:NadR type nicotinamide-nucleotide adenylyltransferase